MAALDSTAELNRLLEEWETENAAAGLATYDPIPKLKRICELVEHETEAYYKMDPDPFDDRHPGRANPNCVLGHLFKTLFKKEDFMNKLISHYVLITRDVALQAVGCRLLYDILPGLEAAVVFQENEGLIDRLLEWARSAEDPLRSYAVGLLGGAMEVQDIATICKERNTDLVPQMLEILHSLRREMHDEYLKTESKTNSDDERHFSMFAKPEPGTPARSGHASKTDTSKKSTAQSGSSSASVANTDKSDANNTDSVTSDVTNTSGVSSDVNNVDSANSVTDKESSLSETSNRVNSETAVVSKSDKVDETKCSDLTGEPKDIIDNLDKSRNVNGIHRPEVTHKAKDILDQLDSEVNETEVSKQSQDVIRTDSQIPGCSGEQESRGSGGFEPSDSISNGETASCNRCGHRHEGQLSDSVSVKGTCTKCGGCVTTRLLDKDNSDCNIFPSKNGSLELTPTESTQDSVDINRSKDGITVEERKLRAKRTLSPGFCADDINRQKKFKADNDSILALSDYSNSTWSELEPYVIGSFSLDPLSLGMKQRLILQYLTPMGEYQEFISSAFEHRAMELVFYYINLKYNKDVRLAFEALKYVAVLLCHKKFAIEFLQAGGVKRLLDVYRPSIAATGVSLCLYYLSYFDDAMERVCLLSDHILEGLVSYVLWLMECSHESSRCHAAMFFSQAFPFAVILHKFDKFDGLRRLFNVISTLPIMNTDDTSSSLSDDQVFTMRQAARHSCVALKRYFETHVMLKVNELKRSHLRNEGGLPQPEAPPYKAIKLSPDTVQENIELMMELMPVRQLWAPEAVFRNLGGIQLLTKLLALAGDWGSYTGKPETMKSALEVISVCCVTPRSQLTLLEPVRLPDDVKMQAISIPISLSDGETLADAEVQRAALSVIINCVCGPMERFGGGVGRFMGTGSKKKLNLKVSEDVLTKMWNGVRLNNGIMVLLKLLAAKTPITDADSLRALACKALVGLARYEKVTQIISKLPLFNNGQLQTLMKEPVLQDKRQEHVKFCKYASELIEKVSGKQTNRYSDASLDDIRKADIVAQSKIIFREKELLLLIYDHLQKQGYTEAASVLSNEASLLVQPPQIPDHPVTLDLFAPAASDVAVTPGRPVQRQLSHPASLTGSSSSHSSPSSVVISPGPSIFPGNTPHGSQVSQSSSTGSQVAGPSTPGPIKFSINRQQFTPPPPVNTMIKPAPPKNKFIKERDVGISPAMKKTTQKPLLDYEMTLDKIVTEYLRKQHALCRNPVVTCPPMSLFSPHQCPEPRLRSSAPISFPARLARKMIQPRFGGTDGSKLDRKYIYSRFKPVRTYRETEDDGFSCCTFATHEQYLILGTYAGNLKLINTVSGEETGSFHCHSSPVTHCEHSRDTKLFVTASSYSIMYSSALWLWGNDTLDNLFNFEDHHLEFSNLVQDRLIGTKDESANIYDISTGKRLLRLYDSEQANNYKANRAVFNPTDEMVLNDGVLWDLRSGRSIHKFDKFNQYVSGVFHPVGLEIIINSEVWDVRNFSLLHTVPALDQCQIRFSHLADVIYATHIDEELDMNDDRFRSPYGSTFRTFDATDYSSIATMDVKSRSISDLCTDTTDCHLAIVENQQSADIGAEENVCRLYSIGKLKDVEDDQNDEEEQDVQDDDDDDDDDDDEIQLDDDFGDDNDDDGNDLDGEDQDDENGDDNDEDDDDENSDDDDDDDDDDDVILSVGSSEDDDSDNDDDVDPDFNIDDVLFELS